MGSAFIKRIIIGLSVVILAAPTVSMAAGTTGATFLNVGVSARSEAMGGAYSAIADDASSVTINPAGMIQIKGMQASLMHNENFSDINQEYLAFVKSDGSKAYGASLVYVDYGTQVSTTASNTVTGVFTPKSFALTAAYGAKFNESISYGVGLKYVKSEIATYDDSTFAIDAGVLYKPANSPFTAAAVLSNLGSGLALYKSADPLPIELKLATSYKFADLPLLAAADLYLIKDEDPEIHLGLQYTIAEIVPIRIGYTDQMDAISDGFSFGIGLVQPQYSLDYAFIPTDNLDDTHRLSVLFNF